MPLQIGVDNRVIVTLGTLEILAHEDAADVTGDDRDVEISVEVEAGAGAGVRIAASPFDENLVGQLVPGSILNSGLPEIGLPGGRGDVFRGATLHQDPVEQVLHPTCVGRAGQQAVDQPGSLGARGGRVGQEATSGFRGGDSGGEVEGDTPQEFGVAAQGRGVLGEVRQGGFDQRVDLVRQNVARHFGGHVCCGSEQHEGHEGQEGAEGVEKHSHERQPVGQWQAAAVAVSGGTVILPARRQRGSA